MLHAAWAPVLANKNATAFHPCQSDEESKFAHLCTHGILRLIQPWRGSWADVTSLFQGCLEGLETSWDCSAGLDLGSTQQAPWRLSTQECLRHSFLLACDASIERDSFWESCEGSTIISVTNDRGQVNQRSVMSLFALMFCLFIQLYLHTSCEQYANACACTDN